MPRDTHRDRTIAFLPEPLVGVRVLQFAGKAHMNDPPSFRWNVDQFPTPPYKWIFYYLRQQPPVADLYFCYVTDVGGDRDPCKGDGAIQRRRKAPARGHAVPVSGAHWLMTAKHALVEQQ